MRSFFLVQRLRETEQKDVIGSNEHGEVGLDILEKRVPDNQTERMFYPKSHLPSPAMALS